MSPDAETCDLCDKPYSYSFTPDDGTRTKQYCLDHVPPGLKAIVDRAINGPKPR